MGREAEPGADGDAQVLRLGGGQGQHIAPLLQAAHNGFHARGHPVLILAHGLVNQAEALHRLRRLLRAVAAKAHKGILKGRADEAEQSLLLRHRATVAQDGLPDAVDNALPGIRQGPVQVEEYITVHISPPHRTGER